MSPPEIARILGVTERGALMTALAASLERNGAAALTLIDELYNQGHDLKRFYQDLVGYARHLLLAGLYPEARNLAPVADAEWEELTRLARQSPAIHLHNVLRVLLEGEEELKRAPQPRLALEVLLLRLIHLEPLIPVADWLSRLEALEKRGAGGPAGIPREAASPPAAETAVPTEGRPTGPAVEGDLEATWRAFLEYVQKREDGPLLGKLSRCRPKEMRENCLWVNGGRLASPTGPRQEAKIRELVTGFGSGRRFPCVLKPRRRKRRPPHRHPRRRCRTSMP